MPEPLSLMLHAGPGPHRPGEPVAVRVELRNVGPAPVPVVGVLDGSETGMRYPHYLPSVGCGDRTVAAPGAEEDPLVGPLLAEHITVLVPGGAVDPRAGSGWLALSTFATFAPRAAGTYRFRLVLDTVAPDPAGWLGRFGPAPDPATLDLLARVPRVRLEATLDVEIRSGT